MCGRTVEGTAAYFEGDLSDLVVERRLRHVPDAAVVVLHPETEHLQHCNMEQRTYGTTGHWGYTSAQMDTME